MITNIVIAVLALVVLFKVVMLLKDKIPGIKLPSLKAKIDADKAKVHAGIGGLIDRIYDTAVLSRETNEVLLKELNGTFERVLSIRLSSPEGRAELETKLIAAKKIAEVAVPLAVKAAVLLA
jgi:hypothetical protein